jgi:hypothetical protein
MGHGCHARRIDRLQRFDQAEDGVQLAECLLRFSGAEVESRELGNACDILCGESQRGPPCGGRKAGNDRV